MKTVLYKILFKIFLDYATSLPVDLTKIPSCPLNSQVMYRPDGEPRKCLPHQTSLCLNAIGDKVRFSFYVRFNKIFLKKFTTKMFYIKQMHHPQSYLPCFKIKQFKLLYSINIEELQLLYQILIKLNFFSKYFICRL